MTQTTSRLPVPPVTERKGRQPMPDGRNEARRKMDALLERSNGTCEYCKRPLVRIKHLQKKGFTITNPNVNGKVIYLDAEGIEQREYYATVDHVEPLVNGGSHDINNLKVCCNPCNQLRNKELQQGMLLNNKERKLLADRLVRSQSRCETCGTAIITVKNIARQCKVLDIDTASGLVAYCTCAGRRRVTSYAVLHNSKASCMACKKNGIDYDTEAKS